MGRWQKAKVLVFVTGCYLVLELIFGVTCPILFLTGISCAGCGMSRAWFCVLQKDLAGTFEYHPLFWTLPIGIVAFFFWDKIPEKVKKLLLLTGIVLFLGVYIWRMLDVTDTAVVFQPEKGAIVSLILALFSE